LPEEKKIDPEVLNQFIQFKKKVAFLKKKYTQNHIAITIGMQPGNFSVLINKKDSPPTNPKTLPNIDNALDKEFAKDLKKMEGFKSVSQESIPDTDEALTTVREGQQSYLTLQHINNQCSDIKKSISTGDIRQGAIEELIVQVLAAVQGKTREQVLEELVLIKAEIEKKYTSPPETPAGNDEMHEPDAGSHG
jgi:hypothetical protein